MEGNGRIGWVDVAKGIAMLFIYLGHWQTSRIGHFAYSFHLWLFFLVSGFFIDRKLNLSVSKFLRRQTETILIPLALWCWISFVIQRIDNDTFTISELKQLLNPTEIQGNYWFLPALLCVTTVYWLLMKLWAKKEMWLILSFFLLLLWGENGVLADIYNPFSRAASINSLSIINRWFSFTSLPEYLFWIFFGSYIYIYIFRLYEKKDKRPQLFHGIGLISLFFSGLLFLGRITEFKFCQTLMQSQILYKTYRVIVTFIIIMSVFYISMLMGKNSRFFKYIGEHSLSFVGLEFITHSWIPLYLIPMFNLGIPQMSYAPQLCFNVFATLGINCALVKYVVCFFPTLEGHYTNKSKHASYLKEKGNEG